MEASQRSKRKVLNATVSSRMGDKSVKVTVPYRAPHPRYMKVINRKTVLHVHDEENTAQVGDRVEIMETRPISRLKNWRITKVIEKAEQPTVIAKIDIELDEPAAEETSNQE
jgi:small subunit ribosomal protein S17